MNRFVVLCAVASAAVLALSGCSAGSSPSPTAVPGAAPSTQVVAHSACEDTPLSLHVSSTTVTAGAEVEVSTTPEHCLVTEEWEGEIIVRLESKDPAERDAAVARNENPDTATGVRIEAGTPQPVVVEIPSGLAGDAYLMLKPDQDCEGLADCYYPYVEISIAAPVR